MMQNRVQALLLLLLFAVATVGCGGVENQLPDEIASQQENGAVTQGINWVGPNEIYVLIQNIGNQLCLDGYNGGGNNKPYLYACNQYNKYQQWVLRSDNDKICNRGNGLCLDDGFALAQGQSPHILKYMQVNKHQSWVWQRGAWGGNTIKSSTSMCLDGYSGKLKNPYMYRCGGNKYQEWLIWEL